MLNFRLIAAGLALTVMSAYVVANLDGEADASCYYLAIEYPEDNSVFYEGDFIDVGTSFELPGDGMDPVDITAELQCTMTSRLEDSHTDATFVAAMFSSHMLVGPTAADSDVADDFCIVVSGGGETDRVGATFVPWCMCCP